MPDNNNLPQANGDKGEVAAPSTVKGFMAMPATQKRVKELLGDRAGQFLTSVSSMVGADDKLARCEPSSLFMACLTAAALDLPINKNLAFAHIVPYNNNSARVTEAQFQMGWKGYVQLAQRSGQYKKLAATEVHDGQLVEEDPLLGNTYNWKDRSSDKVIGYVAFMRLNNGFEKELYMSVEDITKHADKYSKAYNHGRGFGPWKDNFSAMALKTVIKLLISKWGPMSVEMQRAVEVDSSVIKDDGTPDYIDGEGLDGVNASDDKKSAIVAAHGGAQEGEVVHSVGSSEANDEDLAANMDETLDETTGGKGDNRTPNRPGKR